MADIELQVTMLNINNGRNKELLERCRPLYEYSWLVDRIRENKKATESIEEAADAALDEMPEDFLIRKFLIENRGAVRMSILTEYDAERHMRLVDKLAREEGREEVNELNAWLVDNGRLEDLARSTKDPAFQAQLFEEYRKSLGAQAV